MRIMLLNRRWLGAWVLAVSAALALALWHWGDGPDPQAADFAQYLAHARVWQRSVQRVATFLLRL